ncbi:hypothetical protein FRC12_023180 [Ceratobasidium sp. 428]|nr:hypothetical protein FRC12_023180 [Ceratobasidium sp. 428]
MNAISSRSPRPVKSPNEIGLVQSPVSESFNATPAVVSNCMSISAITQLLVAHRRQDVTKYIDPSSYDEFPISGGGFGDIYRGRVLDGTQVAIKRSRFLASTTAESQKILKRSAHELYVWSKYNHPNLLRLIGFAQFRGQIAMVSPWMENGNLSEYIARNPGADRCRFCVQVCEGVTYLHSMNNVHGDLKAANVVVSREGIAKITDFGNTRLQDYTLQFAPTSKGLDFSLRWTAPELVSEQPAALSNESDVYALGMTILEVITGQVPFAGLSELAVLAAVVHRNQTPKRPDSFIPYESNSGNLLWRTLESCWATDSKARATAASVRNTMKKITHHGLSRRDSYVIVNQ